METLVNMPILVAGVALPLLAAAARDDRARLRYAIEGLSKGAVIAGVLVVLVTVRAAEPVMAIIGGYAFRPAGAVLRIQVGALLFIALYQLWTAALLALGRQRELILTNALGLLGVAVFAAVLVPPFGARGGAAASVLGDALLASLIYWRLHAAAGRVMVGAGFLARVAVAAAVASAALLIPGLPDLAAAALAGALFLGVGQLIGMLPEELRTRSGRAGCLPGEGSDERRPPARAGLLGRSFRDRAHDHGLLRGQPEARGGARGTAPGEDHGLEREPRRAGTEALADSSRRSQGDWPGSPARREIIHWWWPASCRRMRRRQRAHRRPASLARSAPR